MAGFIPEHKISEIQNRADIVEIISETVLLKKSGINYIGLCPFHSEKTPSFTVNKAKQIYYCFGCATGGNVFNFVMRQDNISFTEAVKKIGLRYGIEIETGSISPSEKKRIEERETLFILNKKVMSFFRHNLMNQKIGKKALTYLNKRGMSQKIIDQFNLGYAPPGWDNLLRFLKKTDISFSHIEQSGLIIPKKRGGFYDRFRDRIIFPIFDINGYITGFGGRVMDDSMPKYLNSPETTVYSKRRSLYGLYNSKQSCRQKGCVYIVEGYFDLLSLYQYGIDNVVATLGTALTVDHLRILKGFASKMILVYDSDFAGIKAALRSIGIFMQEKIDAYIMTLSQGYDPDSYLQEFGAENLLEQADKALDLITFLIRFSIQKHGLSIKGKLNVISDMLEPLLSINDSLTRSLYIKQLAEAIGVDEIAIHQKLKDFAISQKRQYQSPAIIPKIENGVAKQNNSVSLKFNKMEKKIISMMLQFPSILSDIKKLDILKYFESSVLKSIGELILDSKYNQKNQVSCLFSLCNEDIERQNLIASLLSNEEEWIYEGCIQLISQFKCSRRRILNDSLRQISAVENSDDQVLLEELLGKIQSRAQERYRLGQSKLGTGADK